jgi:glucoamylase
MEIAALHAPGWPGISARWTSSAKSGLGTALSADSRVWFTLSHGIFNEVYYPRIDQACTRDMGLVITGENGFFPEEKRHAKHSIESLREAIPAYRLVNTCEQGRYRVEKEVLTDPERDVVLQRTRFIPLRGDLSVFRLFVLLAPHLANRGGGNTGWVGDYKGVPMLFAEREGHALALACSGVWAKRSVGFVGTSDGWQDLKLHNEMVWEYARAEDGNICLTGEVDLQATGGFFDLALGFGRNGAEAGHRALASLQDGFGIASANYIHGWQAFQKGLFPLDRKLYKNSVAVLRTHYSKYFPGGVIASLSIPWGFAKGDDDLGGYHLAWPRDLVEAAEGLLAAGMKEDVRRILYYLQATQETDGHWAQNMWLDGSSYWSGVQMDETGFPILLVDLARREGALQDQDLSRLWPMVRRAAGFLVCNGPVTPQDRWEEDPGYSPFTLAVEIAALLAAADLAEVHGEPQSARYLREKADGWNANIEHWTYGAGSDIARTVGVDGYYVRIAPPETGEAPSPLYGFVPIKNRPPGQSMAPASHIISADALALVRFGLRRPDDPRILNTVTVIDALLKVETPHGPAWHRYNGDGYGEYGDGAPFDGRGIGHAWPLLTAERACYELALGRKEKAERLLLTLENFANEGGLIPEQVWDRPDVPERELFFGRPSGSAMPLVWAHAEYVKLCRSLYEGRIFDTPPQTVERYLIRKTGSSHDTWSFGDKRRTIPAGKVLRLELLAPAVAHWSRDGWKTATDTKTLDTGLGLHICDLATEGLPPGAEVLFTFFWPEANRWEGEDFGVRLQ